MTHASLSRRGNSRILLVAPHGGRRAPVDALNPAPNLRVNDVYTADLTRRLAERLDATSIINESIDRNEIDLNRITQVTKRAPWFLDVVHAEIERLHGLHGSVVALFVHGWNTGQPICDLGIGASQIGAELVVPEGAGLTVSDEFRTLRLHALQRECHERGITTVVGERYAASHRNNLLQLFALERHRHVDAMQLELAIPLRWPGPWRERFVDACVAAFSDPQAADVPAARAIEIQSPLSLQFYDPRAGIGVFAGVGRLGPVLGGRFLLFLGEKRIALFTGEAALRGGRSLQPLAMSERDGLMQLRFDGPILFLEDGADYLDLEAAFARSRLVHASVEIGFTAGQGDSVLFGTCVGRVQADGRQHDIHAAGFANAGSWRGSGAHEQTMLSAAFSSGDALLVGYDHSREQLNGLQFDAAGVRVLHSGRVDVITSDDPHVPQYLTLRGDQRPAVCATPISRMSILRTGTWGAARITFGVARFERDGADGFGVFEYSKPLLARP